MRKLIDDIPKIKWGILSLLLFLPSLIFAQQDDSDFSQRLMVEILCDKPRVVEGDSCLLSVVVFSEYPFRLKCLSRPAQIRHGNLRRLPIGQQALQKVVRNRRVYYALVGEQYVLQTQDAGEVIFPKREFEVEMQIPVRSIDPFEEMFGIPVPVKKVKGKTKSEVFRLKVTEKPKRTMMEMKQSGVLVL